jgi:hypothetical protein
MDFSEVARNLEWVSPPNVKTHGEGWFKTGNLGTSTLAGSSSRGWHRHHFDGLQAPWSVIPPFEKLDYSSRCLIARREETRHP